MKKIDPERVKQLINQWRRTLKQCEDWRNFEEPQFGVNTTEDNIISFVRCFIVDLEKLLVEKHSVGDARGGFGGPA